MSWFNQDEFDEFVLSNNVISFGNRTLSSGRRSRWYVNWRKVENDVFLINQLADYIIDFTHDLELEPDCYFGVPEGATKIGVITQVNWAKISSDYSPGSHCLPMGRAAPKNHGDPEDRYYLGQPKGKTIVLEDVTTTATSLIKKLNVLKEDNTQILAAYALTNRMELNNEGKSVEQVVKDAGWNFYYLSSALRLLPRAYQKLKPGKDIGRAIEREFEEYGVEKLKLITCT